MSKQFKRQDYMRYLKLGKKSSKPNWRRPKGRDSKMRLKMKGYPVRVSVGFKTSKKQAGKIKNRIPVLVHNLKELHALPKNSIVIFSKKLGAKKKLELIKIANENQTKMLNITGAKK